MMEPTQSTPLPCCPRCESVELTVAPRRSEDVSCLTCPSCGRRYQLRGPDLLTELWMGPLSLLLYPIALSSDPLADVDRAVRHLVDVEGWPEGQLRAAIAEAELELEKPSQRVSKILDLFSGASEEETRRYLGLVARQLEKKLG